MRRTSAIRNRHFPLLTALFCSLLLPGAAFAQQGTAYHLTGVTVVGSKRYTQEDVVRAAGVKPGDSLSLDDLQHAVDRLASFGAFAQVSYRYQTRGADMTAVINVEDSPQFLPCSFENFVWFSHQELLDDLRAHVPLFQGSAPPAGRMLELISAELRRLLAARGLQAEIQAAPASSMGGPIQGMEFREQGVPIPVRQFQFTGVEKIDGKLLQQAAQPLLGRDYDASFIRDFASGTLRRVYAQRGYLKAAFGEPEPRLLPSDPSPNAVEVTLPVTEGGAYSLKGITWAGESAIPYAELAKSLHAAPGKVLDGLELEQDVLALSFPLHPMGYILADARYTTSLDDATHTATVHITLLHANELYRLGKLEFLGVSDEVARELDRLCEMRPGDPYDATYWSRFIRKAVRVLPRSRGGWKLTSNQSIHYDTRTVDARVTLVPVSAK